MLAFMGYLKIPLCLIWLYRYFASWAISHQHRLLQQCQNTALPSGAISLLGLLGCFASWATLPLGLLCLLGCFASWAALPLGPLCLLGCFASWANLPLGLLCLLGHFNMLPLGPCLIDIVCFNNAGILICLLGCANTGHLLVCKNDKTC
jgi:hypothetical protein